MTTLSALFYADVRSFVNQLREIRRSPARALVWLLFAGLVGALIVLRIFNAVHGGSIRERLVGSRAVLDVIASMTIAALGIVLATGDRYAGLFAHPAEARFIIDSPAEPFIATLYVQTRQIVRGGARQTIGLLYFALVYLPATLPARALVRDLVLLCVALAFIAAVPLARQLLPPRLIPVAGVAGVACIITALLVLARVGTQTVFATLPGASALASRLPAWQPGDILVAGPRDGITAIAVLLLATAALFTYVAYRARDAYPELYELSMKRFARTERLRSRPFGWAARAPQTHATVRVESTVRSAPGGVAIFIWRAWTEYRRTNSVRSTSIETALALAGGYAIAPVRSCEQYRNADRGHLAPGEHRVHPGRHAFGIAGRRIAPAIVLALRRDAVRTTVRARHRSRLADDRLVAVGRDRAGGRTRGRTGGRRHARDRTEHRVTSRAIGYASYALLPNDIDQRGPLLFVRLLLGYVLVVPPVAAGLAVSIFEHTVTVALLVAGAATLVEAAVLAGFAAWRLDRMSIALR